MSSETAIAPVSNKSLWAGRVVSALPVLMLIMSGVMKLLKPPQVVEGFTKLGYDADLALGLAIVELACTAIYVFPRTAVLGAILLTGYLGGAVATHVRVGDAYVIPVVLGVLVFVQDELNLAFLDTVGSLSNLNDNRGFSADYPPIIYGIGSLGMVIFMAIRYRDVRLWFPAKAKK